ncbi:MAG: S24 family peptidase [Bilophila sp.]
MTTIAERLIFLRGNATQMDFAERMGINVNTLRAYEKGRALPGYEVLESLCVKLEVSAAWILTGKGEVFCRTPVSGNAMPPLSSSLTLSNAPLQPLCALSEPERNCDVDLLMIPMVEARLSAGLGSLEVSAASERSYAFRSDFLTRKGNPHEMVLMRVSGDSMEPEIRDNDVVLIDQSKRDVTPGRLYAVGFDEAIYLKRIDVLPGKVFLRSTNPDYPPVELDTRGDCEEQFRVIGRILWCGREYK